MDMQLFKLAATQGIWAVLSIFLIIYIIQVQKIRDNNQNIRENNYINIIESLTNKMEILNTINDSVNELKNRIENNE